MTPLRLRSPHTDFSIYYQIAYLDPKMPIWDRKAVYVHLFRHLLSLKIRKNGNLQMQFTNMKTN